MYNLFLPFVFTEHKEAAKAHRTHSDNPQKRDLTRTQGIEATNTVTL